jgi:hypothetical protein
MRVIGALVQWGWLYKKACSSVRMSPAAIPTDISFVHRREKFDAASSLRYECAMSAHDYKRFVARGNEPSARQAERNGLRGFGGSRSHLPSASLPAVASRLLDKPSAVESGGAGAATFKCQAFRCPR